MSATIEHPPHSAPLPPVIGELFAAVRARFRLYALLSGLLLLTIVIAAVFWATTIVDSAWFALQRLELPVGLRVVFLIAMTGGLLWMLIQYLFRPLFRRTRNVELALLLERRFPEFQDGLITTVEGLLPADSTAPLANSMRQRTSLQVQQTAGTVAVSDVFDTQPVQKLSWVAGVLVFSVVMFAGLRPGVLQRWWNAFVLCEEVYHARTTTVEARVVAQPGDRRLEFQNINGELVYLHPRGNDLELELTIPEGHSSMGSPWVVPSRMRIDVLRADGSRSRTHLAPSGRTYRFIVTRLREPVDIELLAGDYRTREPLRIRVVTPPAVDVMQARCTYPDYTGWNESMETEVPVLSSELALPMGTEFSLDIFCNKPLQSARIISDYFELQGDQTQQQITVRDGYAAQVETDRPLLSDDGLSLSLRLMIAPETDDAAPDEPTADDATTAADPLEAGVTSSALTIPSNTSLRFQLHDHEDIIVALPESLRIRGIPDKPPVVAVRAVGVSNSVTRQARIPFSGTIQDDYRIASARFRFSVDDETQWRPRPFRNTFQPGLVYELDPDRSGSEFFLVRPLELSEGQTLAISVVARDTSTIPGPGQTASEPIVFRVVSNEELLSLLYTREVSLRRRLETVIRELERIRSDIQFHAEIAARIESQPANVDSEDRISVTTCATRSGNQLRRQTNELQSIVEDFDTIVQELINNAIPPAKLSENMRDNIVKPLQDVSGEPMADADRAVSKFRVAAGAGDPTVKLMKTANTEISEVLAELATIVDRVRDMAEIHEALSDLKSILEEHQRIMEETKREQIRRLGLD